MVSEVAAEADDVADLRFVNSTFSSLATPKVFRTFSFIFTRHMICLKRAQESIHVLFTNESAQRMVDFLKSSKLVQYLEEIEI